MAVYSAVGRRIEACGSREGMGMIRARMAVVAWLVWTVEASVVRTVADAMRSGVREPAIDRRERRFSVQLVFQISAGDV